MLPGMRLALAVVIALLSPAIAAADPHPMSSGATPAPATTEQVAMTKETLSIAMDLKFATVNAAVTLENQAGAPTRLQVGFPCATGEDAGSIDVPCKVKLAVTANGKKLKVARKKNHWVWSMKLADAEKVELVVTYKAPLVNDRYSVPAHGLGVFTYRLTTGARWAGAIGSLQITLDHMHDALLFVSPAGYVREPGRITWTLTDHEPTEEVVIIPHPMAGNQLAGAIGGKTATEARARIEAGDFKKADVEEAIKALEDQGDWLEDWLKTISRVGGLRPVPTKAQAAAAIDGSIKLLEGMAARAKK
jgi:hypothetical protein